MPFTLANVHGRAALIFADQWYDLERITSGRFSSDPMEAIERFEELGEVATRLSSDQAGGPISNEVLDPPVPDPCKVFGIGLNYRDHAAESGSVPPDVPVVFTKFPSCINGPTGEIELCSQTADYEAELVVVIGSLTRDITPERAWSHVAGLTCGQDISDRVLQKAATPPQFSLGKSRDTYGPIGPFLVSVDSFDDPADLAIRCSVNGEQRQNARTSQMIYTIPFLVSYLSEILTLEPGDLIFTGTPAGVGFPDERWLQPGDEIHTEIEGIGVMVNGCI